METLILPFSEVNCFSGNRNIAVCKTAGSDRPFVLNAYIDIKYKLPGCKFDTANLANGDVKFALISYTILININYKTDK